MKKCEYCGTEYDYEDRCPVCGSGSYDLGREESVDAKQRKIDEKILKRDETEKKRRRAGFAVLAVVLVLLVLFGFYIAQNYSIPVLFTDGFAAARTAKENEKTAELRMTETMKKARELMDAGNYEQALAELNTIDSGFSDYKKVVEMKAEAQASYKGGMLSMTETYVKDGKYQEAMDLILEAEKLVPNDADLQANKTNICTAYFQSSANDARNYANAGQYDTAMKTLVNAESCCGQNSDISSLKTAYTADYINFVFDKANQTMASDGFDAACAVIDEAYSIVGDNADYLARREAFADNKAAPLADLTPILGGFDKITETNADNFGKKHENALGTGDSASNDGSDSNSAVYRLNGKYTELTGTFYVRWTDRELATDGNLYIYGDGQLLYSYEDMKAGVAPVEFSADLTGVDMLKIEIDCNGKPQAGYYQIGEALLYSAD